MDYDLSFLTDALPRDAQALLQRMGIDGADFSGLFEVSFRDVLQGVFGLFQDGLQKPLSFLATGVGVLLLLSVTDVFGEKQSTLRTFHVRQPFIYPFFISLYVIFIILVVIIQQIIRKSFSIFRLQ